MKKYIITLLLVTMVSFVGCKAQDEGQSSTVTKITPEKAKEMIEENSEVIILDVRTEEEFAQGHLKNAILLPDYNVTEKAESVLPDKNAPIIVYCRSGRRSSGASEALNQLGYSNIFDLGGIIDWPYDIVTD